MNFLASVLFFDPGRLDQENERASRAVEDGHFGRIQINPGVVDTEAGKGRHQVFNGPDFDPVLFQTGAHARIANQKSGGGNIHGSAGRHDERRCRYPGRPDAGPY
jgi:hypothetical protein